MIPYFTFYFLCNIELYFRMTSERFLRIDWHESALIFPHKLHENMPSQGITYPYLWVQLARV